MRIGRREVLAGAAMAVASAGVRPTRAAEAPIVVPIALSEGRVLVSCTIGDGGPELFVLDTGGTIGLIDEAFAERLKLRRIGSSRLALVRGTRDYPIYAVENLVFGGAVRQPVAAFAGVEGFGFGDGAVGSLAAGVLTAVDGELDFVAREWRVYRGGLPDRAGWTGYDNAILSHGNRNGSAFLLADARLGERPLRMGLDTGMPSALRLYRREAEAAGLWDVPRWAPAAPNGTGRAVRVPAITLAGRTIEGAIATVLEKVEWSIFSQGIIGLPILRRFDMATETAAKRLYLKPNAAPPTPPRYGMSGLWIDRDGPNTKISVVGPGSPAAAAGLKAGDRLVGSFESILPQLQREAGASITLTVVRSGARVPVTLVLSDYL